jgi:multiple antibiotic resistance protein
LKAEFSYFLFALTSLFTIVNPLGAMPYFSGLTAQVDGPTTRRVAFRASSAAFFAMVFFALSGEFIFRFFNVSVDGLRVVGGVLFFIMGYDMLQGKESRTKSLSETESADLQDIRIKAITPLAIPLICGPGTITVMTVLVQENNSLVQRFTLFASAAVVCLATYFILMGSSRIMNLLGESGQKVFFRLMGLILMMIAVEFFFRGIAPYARKLLQPEALTSIFTLAAQGPFLA